MDINMTKKKGKNSAIVDRILGTAKEPVPKHTHEVTQIELIKILNWYRAYGNDDKLASYLHVYASNLNYDITHLNGTTCTTFGALVRAMENGFVISDNDVKKLNNFCKQNHKQKVKDVISVPVKPKPSKVTYCTWAEDIETGLDCAITGSNHTHKYETSKANIKKCIEYIDKLMKTLHADYNDKALDKQNYKVQIDYLNGLKLYYSTAIKTKSVKRISSNKSSIVKNVKFDNSSEHKFISKPIYPIDIIGKRKLYVYDMKKGKLSLLVAVGEGFTFSGSTIKNINYDKSSSKSMKKTDKLTQQIAKLNTLYKAINRKELTPVTRFNESTIILAYS